MAASSFEINVYQNRTKEFTVNLYEVDGVTPITLLSGDVIRFSVSQGTGVPNIDMSSSAVTPNGSTIQVMNLDPGQVMLRFAQADLEELGCDTYDAELRIADVSENNPLDATKTVMQGVVHVLPTNRGQIGT